MVAHLDSAVVEFRDMKMQPSLERALRYKEILKAQLPTNSSNQTVCVTWAVV